MSTPANHPYKVQSRDLKNRLKRATQVNYCSLSREWYEQDMERQKALVNQHRKARGINDKLVLKDEV